MNRVLSKYSGRVGCSEFHVGGDLHLALYVYKISNYVRLHHLNNKSGMRFLC